MEVLKQKAQDIIQQISFLGAKIAIIEGRFSETTSIKENVSTQMNTAIGLLREIERADVVGRAEYEALCARVSSLEAENAMPKSSNEFLEERVRLLENENTREIGERGEERERWENWRLEIENWKREVENRMNATN